MSTFTLVHPEAIGELPGLLEGRTVVSCKAKKDDSGASRVFVEIEFNDNVSIQFTAGPLRSFTVDADLTLPQFVGAGGTPPPRDEMFRMRAV